MRELPNPPPFRWAIPAIAAVAGALAFAFAWSAGLIGSGPTSKSFVNTSTDFPPGFRRAHGKGMCFVATFRPSGEARVLSSARAFSQPEVPVIGRFSIGTGSPFASDLSTKTVSMALLMATDDHQQWRLAMNNQPFFATKTSQGFLDMQAAFSPDPATGKPNDKRVAEFLDEHPETKPFLKLADEAPTPGSFAGAEFNGVNSFYLVSNEGRHTAVRWAMRPHESFVELADDQRSKVGENYLFEDLKRRLGQKHLYWDLVIQVAAANDLVDDPSKPWPEDRKLLVAGTLEVTEVSDQSQGACRDINYDPTIVPTGIEVSNDPILSARSAAYSHSFNLRERDIGYGRATDAIGKEVVQ
ncbi:catalase family peroxidase [Pseudomonas kurunegalensis]|uniref:catalase family peroxidase n=1 Tax=Pseudomonas kurunegalensis TaxID=485880 RepID=UPI00256FD7F1|nr:catalase family peroxidase [Pseudomonas kurunegalensis]WJD60706.1 catalase family peroxidase [Pseudomonas kurunegalensis]